MGFFKLGVVYAGTASEKLLREKLMVRLKDVLRVANGLSLVAKEALVHQGGGREDLQSLIKKTILSATDLTGLTRGKLRQLSRNSINRTDSNNNTETKTRTEYESKDAVEPLFSPQSDLHQSVSNDNDNSNSIAPSSPAADRSGDVHTVSVSISGDDTPSVKRRRKPRERRVPSTSFSRALG